MDTKEYVLMLGAGLMQRPAIDAIRALGYSSVVIDANPDAPCARLGDDFRAIDLKDTDAIVALASELNAEGRLRGVFTAGTDFSANVAAAAASQNLPGHSVQACRNASNKVAMRRCFAEAGVPSPEFSEITDENFDLFAAKSASLAYPLVVKPVDNMGARGCRMVRSANEFASAVHDAVRYSRSGTAILEAYMDGAEFSIDSVVYDGTLTITGFADRHIFYPPYFIETGHTMSTCISEEERLALIRCFAAGVRALGLTCGAAKADIKLTSDGPMIGEIAARLSGGYMSGWTFPYSSGCNLTLELLKIATGKEPDIILKNRVPVAGGNGAAFALYEYPCAATSAERAWLSVPGVAAHISGLEKASRIPCIKDVFPCRKEGDALVFPHNNVEKCGNVISQSADYAEAVAAAEESVAAITVRLEPNNARTDEFLSQLAHELPEQFPPDAYSFTPQQFAKLMDLCGDTIVPADKSPRECFDERLTCALFAEDRRDWNHISIDCAVERFDELCHEHPAFALSDFVRCLVRGGLQGILYLADSAVCSK